MLVRFDGFRRIPVDLENAYSGTCFLAGGAPSLETLNLALLDQPGVVVAAMNNVVKSLPSVDIGIMADRPLCYSERITVNPKITHFARLVRAWEPVGDQQWKDMPNTYFYKTREMQGELLDCRQGIQWVKNVFPMALALLYYLGFRRVYLIGCAFNVDPGQQYVHDEVKLTDEQQHWNQRTYNHCVIWMRDWIPLFAKYGFEVVSCTPDSQLNDFYPYLAFPDAIKETLTGFPQDYGLEECKHSSELEPKAGG